jgi:hypothetical protein
MQALSAAHRVPPRHWDGHVTTTTQAAMPTAPYWEDRCSDSGRTPPADEGPERGGCPQHEHGSYRDCVHAPSTYDSRANLMARSGAIRHLVALLKRCRRGRQTSSSTLARHARCRQAVPTARASASRIAFTGAWMDVLRGTPISRSWVTSGDCIGTARTPMPLAMPWA